MEETCVTDEIIMEVKSEEQKKPVKDMTVQLIRDELRDVKYFTRKIQRDKKLKQNRSALGQFAIDIAYTEEFVTMTATSLRKKTLNIQDYRRLQAALIQSENHINAFFKADNAIQGLSRDLSGRSTQSKLAAANCCCNLSLGNSKACVVISKFVGPYLIAELESTNLPLVEVCAWTIGNLAYESENAFSILHAQGCMKLLINLARQCSDALLPAASYALLRYMYTGFNLIEETDIVQVGEILAARYPKVSDTDTMWLLALLSSESKNIDFLLKCIPEVSKYLFETSFVEVKEIEKFSAALRIIANVITEPTGAAALHLLNHDFYENRAFMYNLLTHEYFHIRSETLWLIGNLYNHTLGTVQEKAKMVIYCLRPNVKHAVNSYQELTCETAPFVQEQTFLSSPE